MTKEQLQQQLQSETKVLTDHLVEVGTLSNRVQGIMKNFHDADFYDVKVANKALESAIFAEKHIRSILTLLKARVETRVKEM